MELYRAYNVLTDKDRKDLIRNAPSFLYSREELKEKWHSDFPGYQTHPDIDLEPVFASTIQKVVKKAEEASNIPLITNGAWLSFKNGKYIAWHTHPSHLRGRSNDYAIAYYIKLFPFFRNGCLFRKGFVPDLPKNRNKIEVPTQLVKANQNSLLMVRQNIAHTTPYFPFFFRPEKAVLAIDVGIRKD